MQGKDGFSENNSNFKVPEGQASTAIFPSTLRFIQEDVIIRQETDENVRDCRPRREKDGDPQKYNPGPALGNTSSKHKRITRLPLKTYKER